MTFIWVYSGLSNGLVRVGSKLNLGKLRIMYIMLKLSPQIILLVQIAKPIE